MPLPIIEAPRTDEPVPETGIFGVGWTYDVLQIQSACDVQDELRHAPPIQTSPPEQSVFSVQELLQDAWGVGVDVGVELYGVGVGVCVGIPVGVGVGIGVCVGVGVTVPVGVGVGVRVGVSVVIVM